MKKTSKILVLQTHHLGDIILATPALKLLRKNFTEAEINLVVGNWNKQYIDNFPFVDTIIYFDNPFNNRERYNIFYNIKIIFNFLKEIRKERYDLVIELSGCFIGQYYLPFLKSDYKIGQVNGLINIKTFSNIILNKKVISGRRVNEIQRDIDVIKELEGMEVKEIPPLWYPANQEDEVEAEQILERRAIKDFVVVNPITSWHPREWPKERFAKVADWIIKNKDLDVIFVGTREEREKTQQIINLIEAKNRNKSNNFAGLTTIKQTAALLKKAKLFLGNDSGIAHLTATTETPAIVLFGPGDEKRWGHEKHIIVRRNISCYPCKQNLDKYKCTRGYSTCKVLQNIGVEGVIKEIKNLI